MENLKLKTAEMVALEGSGKGMRAPLQRKIRRQAAQILKKVLMGDAQRQSQASIKTLIYAPSIVAKKATLALTCRTLKYLPVIKDVVGVTDLLAKKNKVRVLHLTVKHPHQNQAFIKSWQCFATSFRLKFCAPMDFDNRSGILNIVYLLSQVPAELVYVLTCDMLFGQEVLSSGDAENVVLSRKSALQSALVRLLVKKNVTSVEKLVASQGVEMSIPRYVRVNTLKIPRWEAIKSLQEITDSVKEDDLIPDLLILPAGTDLHKHEFVLDGSLLLQGKASCMPAHVLAPKPGWEVIDACAAPGNKTVHLAALMKGKGRIHACELDLKRVLRLRDTVNRAGASNVEIHHGDFLKINPSKSPYSKVQAILLDPSCSGSGTTVQRLDHLLPSSTPGPEKDDAEIQRVEQLAQFQERALLHALSFPAVERVVYSTCSVHQRENEDVVNAVLPQALAEGFRLATALPEWSHRGRPVFDGAHHLVRTDSARDQMDGFFVALFVRQKDGDCEEEVSLAVQDIPSNGESKASLSNGISSSQSDEPESAQNQEAGKLSKLRRRKLKRQRKKEQLVAAGSAEEARKD